MSEKDVRVYGAVPDDGKPDHVALQAAWNACKHGDTLYLPPGSYRINKGLLWTADDKVVDVSARFAVIRAYCTEPGPAVTFGGRTQRMVGPRFDGLSIEKGGSGSQRWDIDQTGLQIQHVESFDLTLGHITDFYRGLVLTGVVICPRSPIAVDISGCKYGLSPLLTTPTDWQNRITFAGGRWGGSKCGPTLPPPYDKAWFIHVPEDFPRGAAGWIFRDIDVETNFSEGYGFELGVGGRTEFHGCWFESSPAKMRFHVGKRCGSVMLVGGVQDSLDIVADNESTVQLLANGETIFHGTKPHVVRGNLQFQGNVTVQPQWQRS